MQVTFERFMHMQQREVARYRKQHKELSHYEAGMQWIKKYSRVFRTWFKVMTEAK